MTNWQNILKKSITEPEQLSEYLGADFKEIDKVCRTYPMRINPYYLSLIKKHGMPLLRQAVPDVLELSDIEGMTDPLDEENLSPVPNLIRKYPDRALLLVCNQCAMYCRFCTRKQKVGREEMRLSDAALQRALDYLKNTTEIREVILSGGDPFLLPDERLERILLSLKKIHSIKVIRIHTRVPCTLPMRITRNLAIMLKKYHPIFINTHFNHPAEITPESSLACNRLADAGIPLGCQTVLLRGVNDHPEIIKKLIYQLLKIRVKPYYLFQIDQTRGTNHFRTTIETGLNIMQNLIGHVSGMAIPIYALDAPGGHGKIPLTPKYVQSLGQTIKFISYQNIECEYPNQVNYL